MTKAPEDPIELTPSDRTTLKGIGFQLSELIEDMELVGIRYSADATKNPVPYLCPEGNAFFDQLQETLERAREQLKVVIEQSIDYGEAAKTSV